MLLFDVIFRIFFKWKLGFYDWYGYYCVGFSNFGIFCCIDDLVNINGVLLIGVVSVVVVFVEFYGVKLEWDLDEGVVSSIYLYII